MHSWEAGSPSVLLLACALRRVILSVAMLRWLESLVTAAAC